MEKHHLYAFFYRASRYYEQVVCMCSKGIHAHCEWYFDGEFAGSRSKGFRLRRKHPHRNCIVDIYSITASVAIQQRTWRAIQDFTAERAPYDSKGIVGFFCGKVFNNYFHSERGVFCSEAMVITGRNGGMDLLPGHAPHTVDPSELAREESKPNRNFKFLETRLVKDYHFTS